MNRTIKAIHQAEYRPMDNLVTFSPIPTGKLQNLDPFLFLNHHGPQVYPENNRGLPFGPHPHRGIETVTFILDGDIVHKDSSGSESVIESGGIQWMTAGRGLIHSETSSRQFLQSGGKLEILQLWLNLPARLKMTEPFYMGLQREDIPSLSVSEGASLQLISGEFDGNSGPVNSITDIFMSTITVDSKCTVELGVPESHEIFFYVVRGAVHFDDQKVEKLNLVLFNGDGNTLSFEAEQGSVIIFGHGKPFGDPIVAYGPFVMNSMEEIKQAYDDYNEGKFGVWNH